MTSEFNERQSVVPRFSVVCPVYNSSAYVERTIDTVLLQTRLPDEIILIDDGSTDGTLELLENYVSRMIAPVEVTLLNNAHRGPGAARNVGIARARYEWIAFLDSDDMWFPDKLAAVARSIEEHPEVNFVCHHEELVQLDGSTSILAYAGFHRPDQPLPSQLYQRNLFSTSAVVCRRDLLLQHGRFDETLMSAQDYELWLRLSPHLRVHFVEQVLGQYVVRPGNISSGKVSRRMTNELRIAWKHRRLTTAPGIALRLLRIGVSYGKLYARSRLRSQAG